MKIPVEKLDYSRAHGQVYGDTAHNIAFTQKALGLESWPYSAQGDLIEGALNEKQKKALADRRERAKEQVNKAPTKAEIAAQAEAEATAATLEDGETDGGNAAEDDEVNLPMWLKMEARYKPHEIQATLKKRYGVNKPKLRDAALYLVEEQKLLPRSEVHPSILPALPQ